MATIRVVLAAAAALAAAPCALAARGAITLDSLTFDKVVDGSRQILVKFDKQYPYGEKEDAYKAFLQDAAKTNLLVGEVGVQDYGDKENDDLRERFGIKAEDFPVFKLFRSGPGREGPYTYSGEVTADGLRRWVTKDAGIWIGLKGTIEAFDKIAHAVAKRAKDPAAALKEAEDELAKVAEDAKTSAKTYTAVLKKMVEKGVDFAEKEIKRVQGLLKTKVSDAKKAALEARLNILHSFVHKDEAAAKADDGAKTEL